MTDADLTEKLLTLGLDDFDVKAKDGTVMEKDRAKEFMSLLAEIESTAKTLEERGFNPAEIIRDESMQGGGASILRKQFQSLDGFGYTAEDFFGGELKKLLDDVRAHGKEGLSVYRFKGLGEMNPEQLWDTAMDPAKRSLTRVTIEDAAAADKRITVLMGDDSSIRKDYIYRHADFNKIDSFKSKAED